MKQWKKRKRAFASVAVGVLEDVMYSGKEKTMYYEVEERGKDLWLVQENYD